MTDPSTARAKEPTTPWALAAASYLARYSGNTLATYSISLRLLFTWCLDHGLDPLEAKRVHLELYVRYLEHDRGNIPHSVAHHLTPLVGYYRFALIDGWIEKDPTAALRRPRVFIDESRILALDRDELRRLIAAARRSSPTELALIAMLGLLGLRNSEAMGALIEDFGTVVRGHLTLRIVGKGGKPARIPLPQPVFEMLRDAVGDRTRRRILVRPPWGDLPGRPWTHHFKETIVLCSLQNGSWRRAKRRSLGSTRSSRPGSRSSVEQSLKASPSMVSRSSSSIRAEASATRASSPPP